jgi:hypothetical protein
MSITAHQIAQVEQWAASSYTGDGVIAVRGVGTHVHIEEQRERPNGRTSSRLLVRLRTLPATETWIVHRAVASGRWIGKDGLSGSLEEVLDAIPLSAVPEWDD